MYLSMLMVDTGENPDRPRPGRLWLRNVYRVHQRLCMGFPSAVQKNDDPEFIKPYQPDGFQHVHGERTGEQAFLFRIDPLPAGRAMILVQSALRPDWDYAFQNAGYLLAAPAEVKDCAPDFREGQSLRFRLLANATRKIGTKTGEDGKKNNGSRVPVDAEKLTAWLQRKGKDGGFTVDETTLTVQTGFVSGYSDETHAKRFCSARYEGVLQVTDTGQFHTALVSGIGPAKGFGFGLLSVAAEKE